MDRVVIAGGRVIDGTGAPAVAADVAIEGDRIVEIGPGLRGDRRVDADGCVVTPGFVDIHTHYDAQVFWDPALTPSCYHGVTTVVAGNCGFSIAPTRPTDRDLLGRTMEKVEDMDPECLAAGIPWEEFESFPEYLDAVRRRGSALNYSAYIGHTPLRLYVLGAEAADRAATSDEVDAMVGADRRGDGGRRRSASRRASRSPTSAPTADRSPAASLEPEETRGAVPGGWVAVGAASSASTAVRGCRSPSATTCSRASALPITYTAVLTVPSGAHLKAVEIHRERRARGADVWPQVSCRPLSFSVNLVEPFNLNTNPVFAELMPRSIEERRAAYADPGWRQKVRDALGGPQGHPAAVGHLRDHGVDRASRDGRERARCESWPTSAAPTPFDTLLDLGAEERDIKALRVKTILANDDADGIAMLLNEPGCTLGLSDAGAHVGQLCDAPLPTDLLGNWVRERDVLSLEDAVHKLTQEPADLFGFADRGVLGPARSPTSPCSTPTRSALARCAASATSRPTPSASRQISRRACATSWSTASPSASTASSSARDTPRPRRQPEPPTMRD